MPPSTLHLPSHPHSSPEIEVVEHRARTPSPPLFQPHRSPSPEWSDDGVLHWEGDFGYVEPEPEPDDEDDGFQQPAEAAEATEHLTRSKGKGKAAAQDALEVPDYASWSLKDLKVRPAQARPPQLSALALTARHLPCAPAGFGQVLRLQDERQEGPARPSPRSDLVRHAPGRAAAAARPSLAEQGCRAHTAAQVASRGRTQGLEGAGALADQKDACARRRPGRVGRSRAAVPRDDRPGRRRVAPGAALRGASRFPSRAGRLGPLLTLVTCPPPPPQADLVRRVRLNGPPGLDQDQGLAQHAQALVGRSGARAPASESLSLSAPADPRCSSFFCAAQGITFFNEEQTGSRQRYA